MIDRVQVFFSERHLLLKVHNKDNRAIWRPDLFIVISEQISHIVLVFPYWRWTNKCRLSYIIFGGTVKRGVKTFQSRYLENIFAKLFRASKILEGFNPSYTNPTKWPNTLKQFFGCCRRFLRVCLTILRGWRLQG